MEKAMARALARARGEKPESEPASSSASDEEDESVVTPPPSEQEVKTAGRVIAKWGRRPISRTKLLERIGQFDDVRLGSSKDALKAHLSPKAAKKNKPRPLVIVPNVLPPAVAEACLLVLRSLPERVWQGTTSRTDPGDEEHGAGSAGHSFAGCSREDSRLLEPIFKRLECILPKQVFLGQCSRYQEGDFIEPHDDSAFAVVNGVEHSRDVAIVIHLTPNLLKSDGGLFVDHVGKSVRTPLANSMVAFRVPRLHEVTEVTARVQRYSIFGWFMQPGRLYNVQQSGIPGQGKKMKRKHNT